MIQGANTSKKRRPPKHVEDHQTTILGWKTRIPSSQLGLAHYRHRLELTLPINIVRRLVVPLILAFTSITLVAAFAAHINTLSDYDLDVKDETKKKLVEAMNGIRPNKLKQFMMLELSLSLVPLLLLVAIQAKPALLLFWVAAVFLAFAYSSPPLRLKSHSYLAAITLMIVLSIIPVTFVTYVFTNALTFPFLEFLAGQAMTVYAVIIPAEIRDYFIDKT